jgi:hypothetical protein
MRMEWGHDPRTVGALETAALQLDVAMRESERSVAELSCALERVAVRTYRGSAPGPAQACAEDVSSDIAACVTHLQSYDRLLQQLVHIRDFLAAGAGVADEEGGAASWEAVRIRLRSRLISDVQRALFDVLAYAEAGDARAPPLPAPHYASEGGTELF